MKSWYSIKNEADSKKTIYIFDEIGFWGVNAKSFLEDIKGAGDIDLHINSVGGSVFDALAIYHTLKQHGGAVHVYIDGLAASSASIVAMAGDVIYMPENAFLMIHNPSMIAWGDSEEMQKACELLDKTKDVLVNIYLTRSKSTREEIEAAMDDETWYTGGEALMAGFVDVVTDQVKLAASANLIDSKAIPKAISERFEKIVPDLKDFESHLRDAFGFSRNEACVIAGYGLRALKRGDHVDAAAMLRSAAQTIHSIK